MVSDLWDSIDPSAEWRVAPGGGYADSGEDPARQVMPQGRPFYHPAHPLFGFGVTLLVTGALVFYVFETGGAGASAKGRIGPLEGEAGAGVGPTKGAKK